jgi:hypothetical protein
MRGVAAAIFVVTALGAVGTGGVMLVGGYYGDDTKVCTVAGKDRVVSTDQNGNRHSEMRVYTDDCGTFVVGDSLVKGQWRSADLFGSLKEGQKYEFKYHGWRNGFLSMFPTITEAKPA